MKDIEYRIKPRHFFNGRIASQKYVIEVLHSGKWLPMGDQAGVFQFESKQDAENSIRPPVQIASNPPTP